MTDVKLKNQVIALAGIFQAAALAKELAWKGTVDKHFFESSINSLFALNSNSIDDIYPQVSSLNFGLETLINMFSNAKKANKCQEIARYAFSLIYLERKLIKNKEMLNRIQQGISRVSNQAEFFDLNQDNILANIAGIYTDTISKLPLRIYVAGNQAILNNTAISNKVRATLLSGIRAAVLWRQMGGSRLHLIFKRGKIVQAAKELLI